MLIATFGPTTEWVGRTIQFESDTFLLDGHGLIRVEDVVEYDRQGHLVWPYDEMRAWVSARAQASESEQLEEQQKAQAKAQLVEARQLEKQQKAQAKAQAAEARQLDKQQKAQAKAQVASQLKPDSPLGPGHTTLRTLTGKTLRLAQESIGPAENVHVCLVGLRGQALVALDDRLLVLKAGFMAGATFGGKAVSFPYQQITGIEVHHGPATGVVIIQTAAYQGAASGGYWTQGKDSAWQLPNCIPIVKKDAAAFEPSLARIRDRIATGVWPDGIDPDPRPSDVATKVEATSDLAAQLSTLRELHLSGGLTDEEFAAFKAKLMG
jgi:hypothetical protein